MAESFTKLFSSIITSTVWSHDSDTKVVWVTLLALADKNGEVQGSVPGLARLAGVSVEACEKALEAFQAADRYSRTKDHDGRRVEPISGGWALLNYAKYRRMASVDDQKEKSAERSRRYRENKASASDDQSVTDRDASRRNTEITREAEAEAEADTSSYELVSSAPEQRKAADAKPHRLPADWQPSQDCREFASDLGLDADATAEAFVDYWTGKGSGTKRTDWARTWRVWCRRETPRAVGKGAARAFQPARGNDAFYQQLADIARRPDD